MDSAFSQDTMVGIAPNVVSADMGGEEVILNLTTGIYHGLDEVGTWIWSLLEPPCTVGQIHQKLLEEYEVEADRCLEDVLTLLNNLAKAHLIEVWNY